MRRFALALLAVALPVAIFAFSPGPIDLLPFAPSTSLALEGPWAKNTALSSTAILGNGQFDGPEDVAVDDEGRVYAGGKTGVIHRLSQDGTFAEFARTGGHPLGLAWAPDGALIVADADRGLLSVDTDGNVKVLATEAEGVAFKFTDDVDVASDGTIFFTDASARYGQPDYILDLLESRPSGRFMKFSPSTGEVTVLMRDLFFANGVALSDDESFVLVNETWAYRVHRYFLTGEKSGSSEVFIDGLPGFPDGISRSPRGTFWMPLFTVRKPLIDLTHPFPFIKRLVAKLPKSLRPKPKNYGFVVEMDRFGKVLRTLHDQKGGTVHTITSAEEVNGFLYLGTLVDDRVGKLRLPSADL